jgi:hypothetical protein
MLFFLRTLNTVLLISLVACLAGAMTGLIVFAPFAAGAWFLSTTAVVGLEREAATRTHATLQTSNIGPPVEVERVKSTDVPAASAIT